MSDVSFNGFAEFSDGGLASVLWLLPGPPFSYRMVITGTAVRIESRWALLRHFLPSRSRDLHEVRSARLRGTLVILNFPNDNWWSFSSMIRCETIISELESRGVAVTRDA